jgi:prepilin-type N-terminal cleavage/methylation domain-containing protein
MRNERRNKRAGRAGGQGGFSLTELMVVVTVIGILAAFSLPGIARYRRNYVIRGATDQVAGEIQAARMRAITRNATRGIFFATLNNQQYQWVEVPKETSGAVDFATLTGGTVRSLPQGVVFDTPASTASVIGFNSLGALCSGMNLGCTPLTNVPGVNLIATTAALATVRLTQPSTGLTRTITVAQGGRVTR